MMRRWLPREHHGSGVASGKYGLVVMALAAAMLTVALAIAAKLAVLPAGSIG